MQYKEVCVCVDAHRIARTAPHRPAPPRAAGAPLIARALFRDQPRCQHVSARIQPVSGSCLWDCPRNIQNGHGHHLKHGNKCRRKTDATERYDRHGGRAAAGFLL